ncbi:MAG TPA: FAD-binding oxidoreductase [Steroidobacteraceae bacterium]|nr:FAD-binding oxidoreductase [Steroidobacteraceae bacterium]
MPRRFPDALTPRPEHVASYYAATQKERCETQPFEGPARADVCVIGGGYAGLSTALHLARRGVDVALLEQSRLGWGASGRHGGQVHVGMRREQEWLERHVGAADARRFWDCALAARAHLDWLVETYRIDCDLRLGYLHADHRPRYSAHTRRHVDYMRSAYGYEALRYVERDELASLVASRDYYGGSFDARGGHLHALNFALGVARAAAGHGARLHEHAEVTGLARSAGGGWRVTTRRGELTAGRVVLACNGYLRRLAPSVERHVMPINNYIAVTEPLGAEAARRLIANGAAVSDSRFVVNYFRITPDARLLFGGGENYSYRFPRDIAAFVRPHVLSIFPQLKDVRFDYAWGGTLGITPTRMPWVREVEPGLYNASGFSGLGVVTAPFAGKTVAEALLGERETFELFGRVPVPAFPGGAALRGPTLVAAMLFYALRDRL